jgi:hypothetical protein
MDPSVRGSCIRTQDAGVLSRLEISVRRLALVDEKGSRSRIRIGNRKGRYAAAPAKAGAYSKISTLVGVDFSRRLRDSAFSAVIPKILFHQIGGYLPRLDFRRIVRIPVSQML